MPGIKITDINIHVNEANDVGLVMGYARIVLNESFVVSSIRIINGKFGLFVAFPREYSKKDEKAYNICFPIRKDLQEQMSAEIIAAFQKAVELNAQSKKVVAHDA